MAITVKIFTKQGGGGRPSLFLTREFEMLPVTIGRDATCTVALDDPHKHISRVHVELEEENGTYWMSVVSKVNPVMVKGRRFGPGTRLTLNSGDSFEMGEFEVQVLLPEKAQPSDESKPIDLFLGEGDEPQAVPAPEAGIFDEPTYVGTGDEPTYMGPAMGTPPVAAPPPPPPPAAKPRSMETTRPAAPRSAPASAAQTGSMAQALKVFMEAAGLPARDLSEAQAEQMLRDCGAILRAAIEGLMMLLLARAEMRKEFEAEERTMVAARDNNPLKLMGDPHEAMEFLFDPTERTEGFLEPVQAIGDACEDLRAHELALMSGMRAAIMGAVRRFDPQVLEKAFEKAGGGGFSLGGRKSKYWDLFITHQQNLAQEAQEDFNKVFGRDFMAAYQAQLRRLKTGQ